MKIILVAILITVVQSSCDEPKDCHKHPHRCAAHAKYRTKCPCTCAPHLNYINCCANQQFEQEICRSVCTYDTTKSGLVCSLCFTVNSFNSNTHRCRWSRRPATSWKGREVPTVPLFGPRIFFQKFQKSSKVQKSGSKIQKKSKKISPRLGENVFFFGVGSFYAVLVGFQPEGGIKTANCFLGRGQRGGWKQQGNSRLHLW
jgi:hypothetical protein